VDIIQAPLERILDIVKLIKKSSLECTITVFNDFSLQDGDRILLASGFGDLCTEEVLER
jgi:hypothetical protein